MVNEFTKLLYFISLLNKGIVLNVCLKTRLMNDYPLHEVLQDLNGGKIFTTRSIGNVLKYRRVGITD